LKSNDTSYYLFRVILFQIAVKLFKTIRLLTVTMH